MDGGITDLPGPVQYDLQLRYSVGSWDGLCHAADRVSCRLFGLPLEPEGLGGGSAGDIDRKKPSYDAAIFSVVSILRNIYCLWVAHKLAPPTAPVGLRRLGESNANAKTFRGCDFDQRCRGITAVGPIA